MKYIKPAIKVKAISESENLLAASDITLGIDSTPTSDYGAKRHTSIWSDDTFEDRGNIFDDEEE